MIAEIAQGQSQKMILRRSLKKLCKTTKEVEYLREEITLFKDLSRRLNIK